MMSEVPVVIVHRGYKEYVEEGIKVTSKRNKVFILGDHELERLNKIDNVTFVNIENFMKCKKIVTLQENFVNHSSNSREFELFCFIRVYIIEEFMRHFSLDKVFHSDSDNILLFNINDVIDTTKTCYHLSPNYNNPHRMSCSIHNGLITKEFLKAFDDLCRTIYVEKDTSLIDEKIKFHKTHTGGICDMTFYYLINAQNMVEVVNLGMPREGKVFINNFNRPEGGNNKNQYVMKNELIKIFKIDGKNMIRDKINKQFVELINIHFQGGAKIFLNESWLKENLYFK